MTTQWGFRGAETTGNFGYIGRAEVAACSVDLFAINKPFVDL